jgi:hypothetical protein
MCCTVCLPRPRAFAASSTALICGVCTAVAASGPIVGFAYSRSDAISCRAPRALSPASAIRGSYTRSAASAKVSGRAVSSAAGFSSASSRASLRLATASLVVPSGRITRTRSPSTVTHTRACQPDLRQMSCPVRALATVRPPAPERIALLFAAPNLLGEVRRACCGEADRSHPATERHPHCVRLVFERAPLVGR